MLRRINRLLVLLLVVGAALYFALQNQQPLSIHLSPQRTISASSGVLLMSAFAFGLLVASCLALFFGLKGYLRERRLKNRERDRLQFFEGMVLARAHAASGEAGRAGRQWEDILRKDPTNIIASIELSRALEAQGERREALRVVEECRVRRPDSIEALFRAAELHRALGNNTAAIDNLALILYHQQSKKAAELARNLSEELGRTEDALEYQERLETLGGDEQEHQAVRARLAYRRAVASAERDGVPMVEALEELIKRFPQSLPALEHLARLYLAGDRIDDGIQLLLKAAKVSGDNSLRQRVIQLWLSRAQPERALAAARASYKESTGVARLSAALELIQLYLTLDMQEDAARELFAARDPIARLSDLAQRGELSQRWHTLSAWHELRVGAYDKSRAALAAALSGVALTTQGGSESAQAVREGDAPPAWLSTP